LARLLKLSHATAAGELADAVYEYPLESWKDVVGSRLKPRDFMIAAFDLAGIYWRSRSNVRHRDAA
jgi:hypothetical protein